jgi:D-apionolactonase
MPNPTSSGPDYRFLHGRDAAPGQLRHLAAGPVEALFDGADLRRIRVGGREVVRRMYTAVRDVNWDTVLPARTGLTVEAGEQRFRISYQAEHRKEELDLTAAITVEGSAEGILHFTFDGVANSDFPYCRIGLCVLHPPEAAGRPFRAESAEKTTENRLPTLVGPQWIKDGTLQALFQPFERLEIKLTDDLEVTFRFEGDLFEMEDQRNWTDASFKTYSTPLALGFPRRARARQRFRQSVEVRFIGAGASAARLEPGGETAVRVTVGGPVREKLPALGFSSSSVTPRLGAREADLLRRAAPDHLRYEWHPSDPQALDGLRAAFAECAALGAGLELALFLGDDPDSNLALVARELRGAPVRRFLVYKEGSPCSTGPVVQSARRYLEGDHSSAKFLGGTNMYFAELNRTRPDLTGLDGLAFTVNPQVHDGDEMSVMENTQAQGDTVRSARAIAGEGRDVVVSPITLKPRFNPFANRALRQDPKALPFGVDARQASLYAAAWTVASLKHTVEGGAHAVTYFETAGWRGLVETESGSPMPQVFPSRPGMVFPVYWVFRDLAGWRDSAVLRCDSADSQRVVGLALRKDARTRILVANLTGDTQDIRLAPATSAHEATVSLIAPGSFDPVPVDAKAAQRSPAVIRASGGTFGIRLTPYAVACVDV